MILFGPLSFLLGLIYPYSTRLKLKDLSNSGKAIGYLSSISTIGSILGTFVTGFWLISYFGNTIILYFLSVTLTLIALIISLSSNVYNKKPKKKEAFSAFYLGVLLLLVFNFVFF